MRVIPIHHWSSCEVKVRSSVFSCWLGVAFMLLIQLLGQDLTQQSGTGSHGGMGLLDLPSGKRLHNYGKSQSLIGKSTINGYFQ